MVKQHFQKVTGFLLILGSLYAGSFSAAGNTTALSDWLIPRPREISLGNGNLEWKPGRIICREVHDPQVFPIVQSVRDIFTELGHNCSFSAVAAKGEEPFVLLKIDTAADIRSQGYRLIVNQNSIQLIAKDKPGLFYGAQTMKQIAGFVSLTGEWPFMQITDWPDFERRGVMLDVNKDQVPTLETFRKLIDLLASWKINEFQIFFKFAFSYVNHSEVSQHYSPVTAEQIVILGQYCKERFIDLVPYQDGFGKMGEWLIFDQYLPLAECPEPCRGKDGRELRINSLSPAVPGSLELVDELYSELLPNYSSKYVNIGSDETRELGLGRSREMAEKKGVGRVYLEHLKKVKERASKNGHRVQFWGDIIVNHPELIPELPRDMIALVWGYEANYPWRKQLQKFRSSGLDFYVCPGTSAWNAIIGRTDNALVNLKDAAVEGKAMEAMGYLNTNWGEWGNWHPLPVCYPGYLYGAAVSWAVQENRDINIPFLLNQWVFRDGAGIMGQVLTDLGNVYKLTGIEQSNGNIFSRVLQNFQNPLPTSLTREGIERADSALVENMQKLNRAKMACDDASQVHGEMVNAIDLCRHACRLMKVKKLSADGSLKGIPEEERKFLIRDLSRIIANHREVWIKRNCVGGLESSVDKMESILRFYQQQ